MRFTPSLVLHHSALVSFAVNFTSTVPHIGMRDTLWDSGLPSASWIRVAGASSGNAAFLKTFPSAPNKKAYWANISITAVDNFTIWVNGEPIGASGDISADGWKTARVLQAALFDVSRTVFSVLVSNAGAVDPGLLAAIRVNYTDGSSDTLVSDVTWAATTNIPPDFPTPFDTSHFRPAMIIAPFGPGPWGHSVIVPYSVPNALNFSTHTWIWSTADAVDDAVPGTLGFRKTVATPSGKSAQSATILVDVDDAYELYVNAEYVGKPPSHGYWPFAQKFTVGLSPASNTFTVIA
ncbi:hypothetical protein C8J57DRAFT_319784 [Mycena rebaudengoi]|nr:hypothetical protein C8J57DRAFT_319784 [Mycena rebaudengoi]